MVKDKTGVRMNKCHSSIVNLYQANKNGYSTNISNQVTIL
jgi:hypothetical protein